MELHVADHPLIAHKLTSLRSASTSSPVFRELTSELVSLLAYEATRNLRTRDIEVTTPLVTAIGTALIDTKPLIVPILRAGLGMLDGMIRLMPSAEVGFLGMVRNEETLLPVTYAERLPEDVSGRQCILLDPMLATGGSLSAAIHYLLDRGATDVTAICLIAAPEGVEHVRETTEGLNVRVFVGALDEKLDERGYIVPGLGDAGDRLYGTIDH